MKPKRENPINFVLRTGYNLDEIARHEFKQLCFRTIEKQHNNNGAANVIQALLEKNYPGFNSHFPIPNWKQKRDVPGSKKKIDVIVEKDFESSLTTYCKSVCQSVVKYGRKSNLKLHQTMEKQLNLNTFVEPVESEIKIPVHSETITGIIALAERGAKSCKTPDGWEVQF